MGLRASFKRFFDLDEEEMEVKSDKLNTKPEAEPTSIKSFRSKSTPPSNIVSLKSVQQSTRVILVEPTTYEDVLTISEHLKNRKAVVFNVQRLDRQEAIRVIDFVSGAMHISNGTIKKVSSNAFLCALDHVDISGDILEQFEEGF